ncbi:hypothetical protein MesoLjLc_22220 [Mesorhizobium sp. L-8-10]|uniref:glycoside hydrolase family 108 protein n=1 Tax=Mesorhizobium sp. L-8-10 TaxID=2744523 RepID=UPI001925F645|nr:glycoside hydrolase family 108 protein [Mesorhizobium sp. L-8-10]BCH30292.1 hypothetical protein MesoLjLc_22220 [Mesorhizobium sp. L-8-10]
MDRNFAEALKLVLTHEGGWSDHPKDPGGATMKGITLATFRRYVNPKAGKDDLRNITTVQIADIYRRHYWNAVAADDLPDGVDYAVFDFAVNSGPDRAAKYLQAVVDVRQDAKIGPQTLAAVEAEPSGTVIQELCDRRMSFLRSLKTWPTFRKGWTARVEGVRSKAVAMARAGGPAAEVASPIQEVATPDRLRSSQLETIDIAKPTLSPRPKGWLSLILSHFISKGA